MEKNKVMMIIIIVLLVVLLATIAGVFFYTLQLVKASKEEVQYAEPTGLVQEVSKLTVDQITTIPLSDSLSTDLKTSENGEYHVIKLNVAIGINNTDKKASPALQTLLEENDTINMDMVLGILRKKTYEELKQPDGDDMLKEEILTKFRDTYESNLIYAIYLDGIILQ